MTWPHVWLAYIVHSRSVFYEDTGDVNSSGDTATIVEDCRGQICKAIPMSYGSCGMKYLSEDGFVSTIRSFLTLIYSLVFRLNALDMCVFEEIAMSKYRTRMHLCS